MIDKIEEIDSGFTAIWSKLVKLECGSLFVNKNLPNDPFFDKLTNVTCHSEKMIDDALALFQEYNTKPFVYVLEDPIFEKLLGKRNFVFYDTQYVLKKSTPLSQEVFKVHKIAKKDSLLWADIFCKSYNCIEWIDEVNSIVRNSISMVQYLVDAGNNASCVTLYENNNIMGLYCLGTIQDKRRRGLAKSLINHALNQVKIKNLNFLVLETYARDNLLKFYLMLGFEIIYKKKIFTI